MIVYFLRHGLAGDRETWQGDDRERPLTKKGEKNTAESAKTFGRLIPDLDAIITSPLVRADQTAKITAEEFGLSESLIQDDRLSPGFNPQKLKEILSSYPEAKAIMLVGHEPDFSETISAITGGGNLTLKKGGLARVDIDDIHNPSGDLVWLIPPKALTG